MGDKLKGRNAVVTGAFLGERYGNGLAYASAGTGHYRIASL